MIDVDTAYTFPFDILKYVLPCRTPAGHPSYFKKISYADIISTFDIETTALDDIEQSVLWHWQVCVDGLVCVGRTWNEFELFLKGVDENLPKDLCFVMYVHNLSY